MKPKVKPQLIFVCGPYRADTDNERHDNIEAARKVAVEVWRKGHYALCPHKNSEFMSGVCDEQQFLDGSLEMLRRCDAVIMVGGWRNSEGSRLEFAHAAGRHLALYHSIDDVPEVGG